MGMLTGRRPPWAEAKERRLKDLFDDLVFGLGSRQRFLARASAAGLAPGIRGRRDARIAKEVPTRMIIRGAAG